MIIQYIDGTIDTFKSSKHIYAETDDDNDWVRIVENPNDVDADEYDEDENITVAKICKNQVRKIQYD